MSSDAVATDEVRAMVLSFAGAMAARVRTVMHDGGLTSAYLADEVDAGGLTWCLSVTCYAESETVVISGRPKVDLSITEAMLQGMPYIAIFADPSTGDSDPGFRFIVPSAWLPSADPEVS